MCYNMLILTSAGVAQGNRVQRVDILYSRVGVIDTEQRLAIASSCDSEAI